MILLGFRAEKYHKSIMIFTFSLQGTSFFILFLFFFYSFLMFKIKITINQLTGIECPNLGSIWVLDARSTGNQCPLLVLSMPTTWSLSARLMGTDRPLNGL